MNLQIPQANPRASYLAQKDDIQKAILQVLEAGMYILGSEVETFEEEFAAYVGVKHCVSVANGTDAIEIALRTLGIGDEDEVVTVSHTAVATVAAIDLVGATPILVDIDPTTFTLDCARLEETLKARSGRVKAIIPVHLYGHPADMKRVNAIAKAFGAYVIEDCAQSHGAKYEGRQVGTFGAMASYSFYPTKNLGAIGDGGAVLTNDATLAEKARTLRQYGWRQRYISESTGMNTRLDELQAAILRIKLRNLSAGNERRRSIAERYTSALRDTGLQLPAHASHAEPVFHQYIVRSGQRDELRQYLHQSGVGTAIHYPVPVHLQPGYCDRVKVGSGGLLETERACREILSLPMYPELTDEEIQVVTGAVCAFAGSAQSLQR